jgi:hypothetical protein
MKWKSVPLISRVLDAYLMTKVASKVAVMCDISRATLYRMSEASERGEEAFQNIEWGGETKAYHEHLFDIMNMAVEDVNERVVATAATGYYVDDVVGGCYHYVDCEYANSLSDKEFAAQLAMSEEDRELFGYPRIWQDKKKRTWDARAQEWSRHRVQKFIAPTIEAQAKVLAAFAPELYGDKRRLDVNLNGNIGLGVTVIGKTLQPPQIATEVTPLLIDQTIEDVEFNDTEYTPPEDTVMTEIEPSPLTDEQQKILERARSGNPLAQELAARALKKQAEASAPVAPKPMQPPPPTKPFSNDQDDCRVIPTRGYKVV